MSKISFGDTVDDFNLQIAKLVVLTYDPMMHVLHTRYHLVTLCEDHVEDVQRKIK